MYRTGRGIAAGIVCACYGLWLIYRGLTNDIWVDVFGEPVIRRWMYVAGGLVITVAGLAVSGCILHLMGRI